MRRIGILTFHRPVNYGAFLQSFALSNFLAKQFPDASVEVIDYIAPKEQIKIYKNVLRAGKKNGLGDAVRELKKVRVFQEALTHLVRSPRFFRTDKLDALYRYINERYDLVIVGSDAVFNWMQNGYPSAFFMHYPFDIPVMSYAGSVHGLRFLEITKEQEQYCLKSFAGFRFLGTRDENTTAFIKKFSPPMEPVHTCDPTFLIDLDMVSKKAGDVFGRVYKKYGVDLSKPYIVLMLLDDPLSKEIYDYYRKKYTVITLFKDNPYADKFLYDLNPFEWVKVLEGAAVTVTQYFHGALLSMRAGTPAVVVDMSKYDNEYESKFKDLMLRRLNLPELYYTKADAEEKTAELLANADAAICGDFADRIEAAFCEEAKAAEHIVRAISGLDGWK